MTKLLNCLALFLLMAIMEPYWRKQQVRFKLLTQSNSQILLISFQFIISIKIYNSFSSQDSEVIDQRIDISLPTTFKEIRSDYLGMFKYTPSWCRKLFLSPAGLLFFLSWGSTIQVTIIQLQFQRNLL